MLPISNSENRYEPGPLVEDQAATIHSSRDGHAETSITLITPTKLNERPTFNPETSWREQLRAMQDVAGHTTIKAVTYLDGGVEMLIIDRSDGPEEATHGEWYIVGRIGLDAFERLEQPDASDPRDLWLLALKDLLRRRTDRAVLHVRHRLLYHQHHNNGQPVGQPVRDVATVWKGKRHPPYEIRESQATSNTIQELSSLEQKVCDICGGEFKHPKKTPLVLACCSKMMCREDFISWCESKTPDTADCPYCRQPFFKDPQHLAWLRYGILGRTYDSFLIPNQRYSAWESFERMSADLDKHLASNNTDTVDVETLVFLKAWQHIIDGALLEPSSSTPLHLQPVRRRPELDLLTAALPSLITSGRLKPLRCTYKHLYEVVRRGFVGVLFRESLKGSLRLGATEHHPIDLVRPLTAERLGLTSGFFEWVERSLSRTLQFGHVRRCEDRASCVGWHAHAEKPYYSTKTRVIGYITMD